MKHFLTLLVLFSLVFTTSVLAFDGKRKGFVWGGGVGVAPISRYSTEIFDVEVEVENFGFSYNFFLGYAWSKSDMLVIELNSVGYSQDFSYEESTPYEYTLIERSGSVIQEFMGPCWYHYFGQERKSFFTAGGIGLYLSNQDRGNYGTGFLLGCGIEFPKHWQMGGYFSTGKTPGEFESSSFRYTSFSIMLSRVWF